MSDAPDPVKVAKELLDCDPSRASEATYRGLRVKMEELSADGRGVLRLCLAQASRSSDTTVATLSGPLVALAVAVSVWITGGLGSAWWAYAGLSLVSALALVLALTPILGRSVRRAGRAEHWLGVIDEIVERDEKAAGRGLFRCVSGRR